MNKAQSSAQKNNEFLIELHENGLEDCLCNTF